MRLVPIIDMPTMTTGVWRRFGVHLFEVIYPSHTRMTTDERKRMTGIIKRWEGTRTASATVILATGMTGSMQRSVLTAMMMLAPAPHPAKVFAAIPAAVTWLVPHIAALCGEEATRGAVLDAVEHLCAAFRAKRDALGVEATS